MKLRELASSSNTSTSSGLQRVLQDTTLALLRKPELWVYSNIETGSVPFASAESTFNRISITERSKLKAELTSNYSGQISTSTINESNPGDSDSTNEFAKVSDLTMVFWAVNMYRAPLRCPVSASASSITSNSAVLSWQATDASGINYYKLKCGVGTDADNLSSTVINTSVNLSTSHSLSGLQSNTNYACEVTAYDDSGNGDGNANGSKTTWTTLGVETGTQPTWNALPSVSNVSANQADVNWSCSDESGLPIKIKITYQKFRTGYSPQYVGEITYDDVPSGSSITKTVTGLLSDHNYDFNAYCEDQAGNWGDRQVTLSR